MFAPDERETQDHCCQLKEKTVVEWQNEEVLRY
jgi:hypothetical protein